MNAYNPVIPFCGAIQAPLNSGSLIRIQGSPHPTARCFAINLQCGPSVNPRDDIALHLSPVFTPPPRVVRNSLQAQRWGPEESYGSFPFIGGQGFEVLILVESDHLKIAINGQHFTEFRYRLPINRVNYIAIDGDVSISQISIEGSMPAYSVPSAPQPSHMTGMTGMTAPYQASAAYASAPPPYVSGGVPSYPSAAVPPYQSGYQAGYPTQPPVYQTQGPYPSAYPYSNSPQPPHKSGGLGGILGGTLGGLATGAAASSIGSAILGRSGHKGYPGHQKHSSPIPIAGLAAGAGAAALGAAVLTGHHPFKKAKKLFKHKHKMFKHKWHKPKFGKWKHKGWSSGSSSSEEE